MFEKLKEFFQQAFEWTLKLWEKHDDHLETMVKAVLPLVMDVTFRTDLTGQQKKEQVLTLILEHSRAEAGEIAESMINEAIEIATNRYKIQVGKLSKEIMDATAVLVLNAGKEYIEKKLGVVPVEVVDHAKKNESVDWSTIFGNTLNKQIEELPMEDVDSKFLAIKPRILSDSNLMSSLSLIRTVIQIAPLPSAAIVSPILGLGVIGFNIWKRLALAKEYDILKYPPVGPNMLRMAILTDLELKKHYGDLLTEERWGNDTLFNLEKVYNDLTFITDLDILKLKYSHLDPLYLETRVLQNKESLNSNLNSIEQEILKQTSSVEIQTNIRTGFDVLRELFPAMNNWALINSKTFQSILDLIDTVV